MRIEQHALKARLFDQGSAKNVKFFRGSDSDVSPEDMAREVNKFFAEAGSGVDEIDLNKDVEG